MIPSLITPVDLAILRHGPGAPLWRLMTTLENAVIINFIAETIVVLCLGYLVKRLCFRHDAPDLSWRERLSPYFIMAAFVVVPQFADRFIRPSSFLFELVPVLLSAVVMVVRGRRHPSAASPAKTGKGGRSDDRTLVCLRFVLAGVLAAVGVWEGAVGVILAPLLLAMTLIPHVRRKAPLVEVAVCWIAGFVAAFLLEPQAVWCPWSCLIPRRLPFFGFVVFFALGLLPLALVRRFGERRWMMAVWAVAILGTAVHTAVTVPFGQQSASERFVRRMVGDLGTRKLILGDGCFDAMIDAFKPADVKRIGKTSVADREFLLKLAEDGQPLTNRVLVVRSYHDVGDPLFVAALAEAGIVYRKPRKAEQKARAKARAENFRQKTGALLDSLRAMNEGYTNLPANVRSAERAKAQANIRQGWRDGYGGTRMSSTILNIDLFSADRATLESDALNALLVNRDDPAANSVMGQLRLEDGDLKEAELYLRKGVKGGGVLAMSRLAMLLVNTQRAKEAEEWARKGVALVPHDWNLRQPLVASLTENGKYDEALRELETLLADAAKANETAAAKSFAEGVKERIRSLKSGATH